MDPRNGEAEVLRVVLLLFIEDLSSKEKGRCLMALIGEKIAAILLDRRSQRRERGGGGIRGGDERRGKL